MTEVSLRPATRFDVTDFVDLAVRGGGFGTRRLDLFSTHSATTALHDIERRPSSALTTARAVLERATVCGLGESLGATEDAWSTTYGAGTLCNLGFVAPRTWQNFLASLARDGGYSMFAAGTPDAWATGFTALSLGRLAPSLVDKTALVRWIGTAQAADGGITWTPDDAATGSGDVRATSFVIEALRQLDALHLLEGYADVGALVGFVVARHAAEGGFSLNSYSQPCMWGTGEAVAILDALKIAIPNSVSLIDFVMTYHDEVTGGFRRGPAFHTQADVWATRHAVRVLRVVAPDRLEVLTPAISEFYATCELPNGGYTYTNVQDAGDVLSTSAALLAGRGTEQTSDWLASCVMPGGDGFAYMPGRGAEARTSQWATAALDAANVPYDREMLLTWATRSQNRDGGFGRWAGRASEPMSTAAIIATLNRAGVLHRLPRLTSLVGWVSDAVDHLASGQNTDATTAAHLVRAASAMAARSTSSIDVTPCLRVIDGLRVEGAYRRTARAVPDLATTYAVLVARQAAGDDTGLASARAWLHRLQVRADGVAWSPASASGGGLIATALAALIANTAEGAPLPDLSL